MMTAKMSLEQMDHLCQFLLGTVQPIKVYVIDTDKNIVSIPLRYGTTFIV